jgi:hypothetical protein
VEIWIATGQKKDLRKLYPFIRDFAVIDIKEIAVSLGYSSSVDLCDHQYFVLSAEIQKRLIAINSSKRFYRVLYLVEETKDSMPQDLLSFSREYELSYEKIYLLCKKGFELQLSSDDFYSK